MKLLFVTQVVVDRPHGGPRHVLAVARELATLGHDVTLLAPGDEPPTPGVRRLRAPAVPAWIPGLGGRAIGPGLRLEALHAARVAEHVRRDRPDVAYVRVSATSSLVPATLAALGVPYVLELNGRILAELGELGRAPAAVAAVKAALVPVFAGACAVVAVEDKIGRHATDALGAKHVVVIENGADLSAATPGDRAAARAELGLDRSGRYVAFTGTLVPELRLDLLFDALGALPGVTLVAAGGGPQEAALAAAAKAHRIVALGVVPHAKAVAVIRAADVCVNVRDGDLGMKCLEYAAIGRRIVTLRLEGTERLEALYPGLEAVHLVDERSGPAIARAIEAALDAEARLGPLPARAIDEARRTLGWDQTARRISEVLEAARARA